MRLRRFAVGRHPDEQQSEIAYLFRDGDGEHALPSEFAGVATRCAVVRICMLWCVYA